MKQVIVPLMVLLAMLCSMDADAMCNVNGRLTDAHGKPLIAATIALVMKGKIVAVAKTDQRGAYCFGNINTGSYVLQVVYQQRRQVIGSVQVKSQAATTINYVFRNREGLPAPVVVTKPNVPPVVNIKSLPVVKEYRHSSIPSRNFESRPPAANKTLADEVVVASPAYQQKTTGAVSIGGGRAVSSNYARETQAAPPAIYLNPSTETYKKEAENDFRSVKVSPLSTMSVDVDRASYSNVRRFITQGQKPPADAVRIEEMINYFYYNYPQPTGKDPIAISTELSECPWDKDLKLLRIGIQAKKIQTDKLPPSNLVFLLDVSGSMEAENKLPLVKAAMKLLVNNLRPQDKVSIVVYAGNAGLVLPPTSGDRKATIIEALDKLNAGGSTAGGQGILLAYKTAQEYLVKGGNNRVILATDGDFNVGVSNENELEELIVKQRDKGIYLTCLGFGMGNYKDSKMELLADKGNGNYNYIDNIEEARKTFVHEFGGTLFTVAKDVKAQIEFNPAKVQGYRLVGYENRVLNNEDFKDDKKDAGDMGAGHTVTILYEIVPAGVASEHMRSNDPLKYQQAEATTATGSSELATVKFRYKKPDGNVSTEMVHPIADRIFSIEEASANTRFAASVAMFGMLLKQSKYKGSASYNRAIALAANARGDDHEGYKAEYLRLLELAR